MQEINLFTKFKVETKKTTCGGLLALFTIMSVFILLISEIIRSFQLEVYSMIDSTNLDERIRVNLNITIHNTTCFALSLDQQDITGTHLEDMEYTIHKLRLRNGKFVDSQYAESVKQFENSLYRWALYHVDEINDCYGAQLYEGQKCLTCQDVLLAYASRDWPLPKRESIQQCKYSYIQSNGRRMLFTQEFGEEKRGQQFIDINDLTAMAFTYGESCQVFGHFYIKRIPGNFHISFHGKGQAVQLLSNDQQLSHTIHSLEFTPQKSKSSHGSYIPTTNTLDNTHHQLSIKEDTQYYLKLVEAHYETLFQETDLITFTAYEQKMQSSEKLPQILFKYEFDPITTVYKSKVTALPQLLIAIFGVVGGVFSMSQFINSIINRIGL